ncbi:glycoside hydrolase family 3 C-terminal domain-containing protein [Saccharophagus degradans]|uniref:Beta-D-glucoside glucohydrolase n=1 Tax=Saccharophagus degradans TaxID=86304 RepID=A0AAW7X706_9GAMM|nr:glycoside hydrolase family 3 C-terminal domain-containing protein [Saccharophagus degradans]MDO6422536.1 glycoside hydrolase family 3 C-terminal domain-containing protein [Saccharophagus degradans]MDO6607017.1 glycoside hydrolase family 3 C-terminal domain-containing protein [Saccharophagus degradans]
MNLKHLFLAALALNIAACNVKEPAATSDNHISYQAAREARLAKVETEVERLLPLLTLEEKASLVHANSKFSIASIERLGIHEMWMSDGPHGVRYQIERHGWAPAGWTDDNSTYLPPLTTVAASWNPEIAALHGDVLGAEARHRRKDVILGPGVNLARLPLYGRNFEYMGEDPFLASRLAVAEIKAIQENDVAACIKHFALNNQELNRTGVNAKPDERTLREVYLPAFEAAVKEAGVHTIMGAYNEFRGTNANQSKHLVMDILKGEWGYKGVLLTDWNVDINTYDAAVNGLDIEMGTNVDSYDDYMLAQPMIDMIKAGTIPESVLDDKVRRILRVQLSIGMMDKYRLSGERNTAKHHEAARKIASEGIVLLKNENILPLNKNKIKNVLVLGPNADKVHGLGGGSSEVPALYEITPLQGLKKKLGDDVNITVMRARYDGVLMPIASDYVTSRHWTGTPAWNMVRYSDAARTQAIGDSAIVDSAYSSPAGTTKEYVTMTATIKPLKSGEHTLKTSVMGDFELKINGKTTVKHSSTSGDVVTKKIALNGGETYSFEILYSGNKNFTLGWDAPGDLFTAEKEYIAAAKKADVVFYFGGLTHGDDREAIDRPHMKLPNHQDPVISKVLAANPNTVVFLIAGSAVEMPWADKAKAIVWGWYGGMEAGNAYADMLFGDTNPSGKMPITLPKALEDTAPIALNDYNPVESLYTEGVFIGYRWFEKQNIEPLFPFGHGLSYTQFKYNNIKLSSANIKGDQTVTVSATITNTGKVAGAEVVQLYLHDEQASVERPAKELKGFQKVFLEPGESKAVNITLNKRALSFWDENSNDWLAETGKFNVLLGASVSDIRLQTSFQYQQ